MDLENEVVKHILSVAKEYDLKDDWEVLDFLTDEDRIVWRDPDINYRRWYHVQDVVAKVGDKFVKFPVYHADGDSDVRDALSEPLNGIHFVVPYEETITITRYKGAGE